MDSAANPKICICVLMNHPYLRNLPLLRRLYQDRCSRLVFLVPFERVDDEDVITVYRGSYCHAAYVCDARSVLADIDCDFFVFVHDDVILNPRIDEATFSKFFPLGPNDGFIPGVGNLPEYFGEWSWYYGFVAKALFPKSILFGGGVEFANMAKYLPGREAVANKLTSLGVSFRSTVNLSTRHFDDVEHGPSRILLHGLSADLPSTPEQQALEQRCLVLEKELAQLMLASHKSSLSESDEVELPFPVLTSGFYTDFYILPKTKLPDFAHFIGVAAASNLFVEIMAPTILYAVCDRVVTAYELGFDLRGFGPERSLERLADPSWLGMHPFKLSALRTQEDIDRFFNFIADVRAECMGGRAAAKLGHFAFNKGGSAEGYVQDNWHEAESWGRWSASTTATLGFDASEEINLNVMRLQMVAPTSESRPVARGSLVFNGGRHVEGFSTTFPENEVEISVPCRDWLTAGRNVVEIVSEALVRPCELSREATDTRSLGLGIIAIKFE